MTIKIIIKLWIIQNRYYDFSQQITKIDIFLLHQNSDDESILQ